VIERFFNEILELIYPENITCIICDKPINKNNAYSLCKNCFDKILFIKDGCEKCGKPMINHSLEEYEINRCEFCSGKRFYFDKVISCMEYSEISKKIVFGLKYYNKTFMSKYIANIMYEKLSLENIDFDYILFVPIHKKRLKKRGFNQSEKIAKYLSKLTNKEVLNCVKRKKYTRMLHSLSKLEREKELKEVFVINKNVCKLENKKILLVDDIFTTGTTTNEISKLLKSSKVDKIYVITLLTRTIE
jgi:competence protein ComFC